MSSDANKRIIFLEFNELCPTLLEKWMADGSLPNFKSLYNESAVFVTESDETNPQNMEPWIQWYSLHTGLPFSEHKVFHLTDGPKGGHADVWQILRENGQKVMNFSSMNAKGLAGSGVVFFPDPWCTSEQAAPVELNILHQFIANRIQEYTNPNQQNGLAANLRVVAFLLSHGLSLRTIATLIRQLIAEFTSKGASSWKRVFIMNRLLLDVFKHYWRSEPPNFATFFSNSTAHLQHSYWRHMDQAAFEVKPPKAEVEIYANAILAGYKDMDAMLGEFRKFARDNNATLMFATALSQQPFLKYEATGGQHFYRPHDVDGLLHTLGIQYKDCFPVMTHQYQMIFSSSDDRLRAEQALNTLYLGDRQVFELTSSDPNKLYFGCQINRSVPPDASITLAGKENGAIPFNKWFYKIDALKSGRHHPDGCFWIQTGTHSISQHKVSILDILPTVLRSFSVTRSVLPGKVLSQK